MKLSWEIEVLSKAIFYPNLSVAASQIGLSQPQLSRILSRVEAELDIRLLDRDSKRKVSWRPEAEQLAQKYLKASRLWESELQSLNSSQDQIRQIKVGCLEGLSEVLMNYIEAILKYEKVLENIEIEAVDLGDLEKGFLLGDFDLILSSRSPGKKKFSYMENVGYQSFVHYAGTLNWVVQTPFENAQDSKKKNKKTIITKSLWLKNLCREKLDASASIPQKPRKKNINTKSLDSEKLSPVFMIAQEYFPKGLWSELLKV